MPTPEGRVTNYYRAFGEGRGFHVIASHNGVCGIIGVWETCKSTPRPLNPYHVGDIGFPGTFHQAYDNKAIQILTHALNFMSTKKDITFVDEFNGGGIYTGQQIFDELTDIAKYLHMDLSFLVPRTLAHENVLIDVNVSGMSPHISTGTFTEGTHLVLEDRKSTIVKIKGGSIDPKLITIDYLSSVSNEVAEMMSQTSAGDSIYIIIAS